MISAETHYMLSDFSIVFRRAMGFAPFWVTDYLYLLPKKDVKRLNSCRTTVHKLGKKLLAQGKEVYDARKEGGKDVMSMFGQWVCPCLTLFCQLTVLSLSQGQLF